MGSLSVRF